MRDRLWAEPDVRVFMAGRTVSELGSRITREGLPIVAILAVGATAPQVGLLAALSSLAGMAAAPWAGVLVDRVRRRPVMIAADVLRALALLTVPVAAFAHRLSFVQIAVVFSAVGGLAAVFGVADQAWLPRFVSRRRLAEGNALVSGASAVGETGGPALMGVLFQWLGGPLAIAFDALSYVASAVSLLWIRQPEPAPAPARERAHPVREALAGLRAVMAHPVLRPLTLTVATQGLFGGFFSALYEIYALRTLHLSPLALGLLITAGGAGALVGSAAAPALMRRLGTVATLLGAGLAEGALAWLVPLAHPPFVEAFGALCAAQLCGDLAGTVFGVNEAVVRQTVTPDSWLGRVGGSRAWLAGTLSTLGALAGGALAAAVGVRAALYVAAAGLLLAPCWLLFSRVRRAPRWQDAGVFAAPPAGRTLT